METVEWITDWAERVSKNLRSLALVHCTLTQRQLCCFKLSDGLELLVTCNLHIQLGSVNYPVYVCILSLQVKVAVHPRGPRKHCVSVHIQREIACPVGEKITRQRYTPRDSYVVYALETYYGVRGRMEQACTLKR